MTVQDAPTAERSKDIKVAAEPAFAPMFQLVQESLSAVTASWEVGLSAMQEIMRRNTEHWQGAARRRLGEGQ